LDQDFKRN